MKKIVTKNKSAVKALKDPELQSMFNQMVGAEDPDPKIIAPKYDAILDLAKNIVELFRTTFKVSKFISQEIVDEFSKAFEQIHTFCDRAEAELNSLTIERKHGMLAGNDVSDINSNAEKLMAYLQGLEHGYNNKELGEAYKKLKDCEAISSIITACRDLRSVVEENKRFYKKKVHDLEARDTLCEHFILSSRDDDLCLITSITVLDFKQLWLHDKCDNNVKRRVIYTLHLFLKKASRIVEQIMKPDIDVTKFSEILISSMDEIRKRVPRCDKAFDKIKNSIGLLQNNFGSYYKDYVTSKNPGVIVQNFVSDVAEESSVDRETTMQFRRIVNFYRERMQGRVKDPQIEKILDVVSENLTTLERKTGVDYGKNNE